jgi:hypothetical protein
LNSKFVGENIRETVVKVEIDTFLIAILTPTAGDGLTQLKSDRRMCLIAQRKPLKTD